MNVLRTKLYQRVTNLFFALAIIMSSLTVAIAPFLFSQGANAATSTVCATTCDFTSIQAAVNAANNGDVISVGAGDYSDVTITKPVTIQGAGAATTRIVGSNGNATPVTFSTSGATLSGFTITHDYTPAELTAWNFNNNGVIFNQTTTGNTLSNNVISKNRNGIYINNAQNNVISGNTITDNRTGLNLTNNISGTQITNNNITNNWTLGMVFYQASAGNNTDVATLNISGNTFNQNWYTEVGVKDAGGSHGVLDLRNNTFTDAPVTYSTSSDASLNEPGFAAQIPVEFGGSAVKPGTELPTVRIYNSPLISILYTLDTPLHLRLAEFACGGVTNTNNITPSWDAVNGAVSYDYRVTLNGNQILGFGTPQNVGNVLSVNGPFGGEGLSTFSVRAVGANGSVSEWATPCAVSYDITAPAGLVNASPFDGINTTTAVQQLITWSDATDANGPIKYFYESSLSNAVNPDGSFVTFAYQSGALSATQIPTPGTPPGVYYWHVRAVDAAGNSSPWTTAWKITVDNTAPIVPTVNLTAGGNPVADGGSTNSQTFTFNLGSSSDTTRYQLKYWNDIAGSSFKVGSEWNPNDLAGYSSSLGVYNDQFTQNEGTHFFSFSACDASGNCSAYSAPFTVTFDKTGPAVDVNEASFTTNSFTITGDVDADAQTVDVVITDQANNVVETGVATYTPGETTWSYATTLANGTYTVTATANDSLGNNKTANATILVAVVPTIVTTGDGGGAPAGPQGGTTIAPQTPQIIAQTAAVLGATTDNTDTTGDTDVKGATDNKVAAVDTDATDGSIFGLAWYWWILILAALAGITWGIIGAVRRNGQDS